MKFSHILILLLILTNSCSKDTNEAATIISETEMYFPPVFSEQWETISPEELNWKTSEIKALLDFLNESNTKGFIILHNGKIAIESYFNNHSVQKIWYWASAGKTLTSIMTGISAEKGLLNINAKVSDFLGTGWTSINLEKEDLITIKHLLNMTSGIDDSIGENVAPENLQFKADAGTRWAYHNVYVKLQDVIEKVTETSFSNKFNSELKDRIGMSGTWIQTSDFSVYYSNTRSMARFGLLALNKGTWDSKKIINENFFNNSINTSQNINKSYGYLWWLNGKDSFHLPQSQNEFIGSIIPNAPNDMYTALGKNDQKIYVIPSSKLVIIRMGESAENSNFALSNFDNELWQKINAVIY